MRLTYYVRIHGGIGPDVWDDETIIEACDFAHAARKANWWATSRGGEVSDISQEDAATTVSTETPFPGP